MDAIYSLRANNLSDLDNVATARTNLGLGTASQSDTGTGASELPTTSQADARYTQQSNNLSDLDDVATARTNLGSVPTLTEADARYLIESNNLSDLDDAEEARDNLNLGTAGLYNAFTGTRDLAVVPVGLISQWNNDTIPPDDWVIARGQSTSVMSQQIRDIFGNNLPDLQAESTNTESIIHTGPLISDFYMPLRDNLDIVSGTGPATFTRDTTATYVDRFGTLRMAAINEPRFEREGILIEGVSTNIVPQSEDFSQSVWIKTNSAVTEGDGFGSSRSWIVTRQQDNNTLGFVQVVNIPISSGPLTLKVRFRTQEPTVRIYPRTFDDPSNLTCERTINLESFTFSGSSVGLVSEDLIFNNGWYEYTIVMNATSDSSEFRLTLYAKNDVNGIASTEYTTPQVESLPFASSYIPTAGAAVTRSNDRLSAPSDGNVPENPEGEYTIAITSSVLAERSSSYVVYRLYDNTGTRFFYSSDSVRGGYINSATVSVVDVEKEITAVLRVSQGVNTLFVNGESGSVNIGTPNPITRNVIAFGGYLSSSTVHFYGHIRNFRIWNRALSATEIP